MRGGAKERRRVHFTDDMSDHTHPDYKATDSNEEAIAKGMLNLTIACTYMQQQTTSKAVAAGNLASRSVALNLGLTAFFGMCSSSLWLSMDCARVSLLYVRKVGGD